MKRGQTAWKPRDATNDAPPRDPLPVGYGPDRERMFRRYALSIPLQRRVVVVFRDDVHTEQRRIYGIPYRCMPHILYLQVSDHRVVGIPKGLVITIEGAPLMADKQPLAADDPKFQQFGALAAARSERVRVEYLAPVPDDPALPQELRDRGIPSTVEGRASSLDATWLHIALAIDHETEPGMRKLAKQAVPRTKVLDITFLGPTIVDPSAPAAG